MTRSHKSWLLAAFVVALLVRVPGIFWGSNFPTGWFGHHVDEYAHLVHAERIINPTLPPRWPPHPYPSGTAAHAALPLIGMRAAQGQVLSPTLPSPAAIITTGRVIAAIYVALTVLILYLLAARVFTDRRVPLIAAWFIALGGLHVSQSHFFLADIPALFWLLAGLLLLWKESTDGGNHYLYASAIALGMSFGLKLSVFALPTLAVVAMLAAPRLWRMFFTGIAFISGIAIVTAGSYTTYDLIKTFAKGISDPYKFSKLSSFLLYVVELPSVVSLPFAVLAVAGSFLLLRRLRSLPDKTRAFRLALVIGLPCAVAAFFVLFTLDHFPRHLITLIPWMALAAAAALVTLADKLAMRGFPRWATLAFVFGWMAVFVYDGERVFLSDPRNHAAQWVIDHLQPGGTVYWTHHNGFPERARLKYMDYPDQGRPDVIVAEMHTANHYLSGMGLRNSFPGDYRRIFASRSQSNVDLLQALFRGTSEYREVARFGEGYFMPEYRFADWLIGNRSRNYVAEIVVFRRDAAGTRDQVAAAAPK